MVLSDTLLPDLGYAECPAFPRPSKFLKIINFTQLIGIFAQCVKERTDAYIYAMHKEALRCVNDTCTKFEKKRKDAIPAFIAVFLPWAFFTCRQVRRVISTERSTRYHRVHFSSQLCFQRPELSFPFLMVQKDNRVELTLSTHIMFPYTRYKVICTRQYTLV